MQKRANIFLGGEGGLRVKVRVQKGEREYSYE